MTKCVKSEGESAGPRLINGWKEEYKIQGEIGGQAERMQDISGQV